MQENFRNTQRTDLKEVFDPEKDDLYCGRCGRACVPMGHMLSKFLLCPQHGEFTMAPVVMLDPQTQQWIIKFDNEAEQGSWHNCQAIDSYSHLRPGGNK